MDDISKGCVVTSKAGRDKGKNFFVLDRQGDYALLVDGKIRRIENPKRKKIKHMQFFTLCDDSKIFIKINTGVKPENAEIRKALALLTESDERGIQI